MIKKSLSIALLSVSVLALGACSSDDDAATTTGALTTDGTTTDAMTTVGTTTVGTTTDAMTTDGTTTDAMTTDGATTDAMTTDGATTDAMTTDGATTDAMTTDGATTDAMTTDGATTDGATTDGATTDGATTDGGTDNPANLTPGGYLPGTLTALIENSGGLSALMALKAEGLDLALNDPGNTWTVFLPTDDAVANFTGDAVDVQAHIYVTAPLDSTALTGLSGTEITGNRANNVIAIGGGGTEALTIAGHDVVTPDLMVDGGQVIVHLIDGVITP